MDIPIASQSINFPGYGMFWVANTLTSTFLGWNNREVQKKAHENNLEFQLEMERARFITEEERIQKEIAFKRRLMAVSREFRQTEKRAAFNEQIKALELKHYLQYCWPLDPQLPYVFLKELADDTVHSQRLNVILMHSPFLPLKAYGSDVNELDAGIYSSLEYDIRKEDIPLIGISDIDYREGACIKPDMTGGNASIMNIHFLMSQMPTLVISPQYRAGRMYLSGAVWEPLASRPLIRPLINYEFNPAKAERNEEYRQKMIDLYHASISVIIGTVRDSYMLLTQGKTPTLLSLLNDEGHAAMKEIVMREPCLKGFVHQENKNILDALDEKNMPRLLEVYNPKDIESIKEQVISNDL